MLKPDPIAALELRVSALEAFIARKYPQPSLMDRIVAAAAQMEKPFRCADIRGIERSVSNKDCHIYLSRLSKEGWIRRVSFGLYERTEKLGGRRG